MCGKRVLTPRPVVAGAVQTSADAFRRVASLVMPSKRQTKYDSSAERAEKCDPRMVTGVPPSAGPLLGAMDRNCTAGWYSNVRAWCAVVVGAKERRAKAMVSAVTPSGAAGETHCTRSAETHTAGEEADLPK